ncbi:MAG: helix-turn-helix domain-containing protein [Burkholderiaceae bacterium]|nr:MAG: helix-turn-helix domain-containing protein [Burkholderiaceae bacterium]TAM02548.1 MAG: helix-turn-helix domain-containing protein [Pusillimonas sp.]
MKNRIPTYALYGQTYSAAELDYLFIETIDESRQQRKGNVEPHRHSDLHQLVWIEQGSVGAILDEERLTLQSPVLISVPSPVIHAFQLQTGAKGVSLTLSQNYVKEISSHFEGMADSTLGLARLIPREAFIENTNQVSNLFGYLSAEYLRNNPQRRAAMYGYVMLLFVEIVRLLHLPTEDTPSILTKQHAVFRDFEALVEVHFNDRWHIENYVNALATNERTLRRICHAITGLAPGEILQRRIALEAKRSLLYTDKTVAEICYALGFNDPAHFTKFFIRNTNTTPTAYRLLRKNQLKIFR